MTAVLLVSVYLFALAAFLGLDVLGKVAPNIHAFVLAGVGALSGVAAIAVLAPAGPSSSDPLVLAGTALAGAAVAGGLASMGRLAEAFKKGKRA